MPEADKHSLVTSYSSQLVRLAIPMIISQGAMALMIFTDRYFLSQVSALHMAASLGGGITSFFVLSFFTGLISYASALVAQYYGEGMPDKCAKVTSTGIIILIACLPIIAIVSFAASFLFSWMGHAPEQIALELPYFIILQAGSIFSLIKIAISSFFIGIGNTRLVMIADSLLVFINIPLSYLFIFGSPFFPALGIEGAALSTILSSLLILMLYIAAYFRKHYRRQFDTWKNRFYFDKGILNRYMRLGLPSGIEMFLDITAFNCFLLFFQSFGIAESASAAIIFNWDTLSFIPLTGLGLAVIALVGRNFGDHNIAGIHATIKASFILSIGYAIMLVIIFSLFKEDMVTLFLTGEEDDESIKYLADFMMTGLISYLIADAVIQVSGAIFRATGDTKWLMLTSVTIHWVMFLSQVVLVKGFNRPSIDIWLVFVATIIITAIIYARRLTLKRWTSEDYRLKVLSEH